MKTLITAMAALLLCTFIACDSKSGSSSTKQNDVKATELAMVQMDSQGKPAPPARQKNFTEPEIKPDSDVKDKLVDEGKFNTEDYDNIVENKFLAATQNPLSTFSIDVDEAAYSNIRRYLQNGSIPPAGAVRIEEMINYFDYSYNKPVNGEPFAVNTEMSECPWNPQHKLVHIGLQGKEIPVDNLPPVQYGFPGGCIRLYG